MSYLSHEHLDAVMKTVAKSMVSPPEIDSRAWTGHDTAAEKIRQRLIEIERQEMGKVMAGVQGVAQQHHSLTNSQLPPLGDKPKNAFTSADLEAMVRMRLRSTSSFFAHWHMHKVKDEKVIVLVVTPEGNSATLEDEWPLFPSDALITKLRLLEK